MSREQLLNRRKFWFIGWAILIGAGLAILFLAAHAAAQPEATTILVTATDGETGGPECRLRDAISAANLNTTVGGCAVAGGPPYIIELQTSNFYTLTKIDNGGLNGANGLPVIANDITIEGNNSTIGRYRNMADIPAFRLFQVAITGTLRLVDVHIDNGGAVLFGGGLYNLGKTEISNSEFIRNQATDGGGVFNQGTLTITQSTMTANLAGCGGAIFQAGGGKAAILNSKLIGNSADT